MKGWVRHSFFVGGKYYFRLWRSVMFLFAYMLFDLRFWVVMWGVGDA